MKSGGQQIKRREGRTQHAHRFFAAQHAGLSGRPRLHFDPGGVAGYPVRRSRRVVFTQAFDIPVRIREHVNSAVTAYKDRKRAILAAATGCRFENLLGLSQKGTHWKCLSRNSGVS